MSYMKTNRFLQLILLTGIACSGGSSGSSTVVGPGPGPDPGPAPPPDQPPPAPTTGSVIVSVRTVGEATDDDGFVLTLDGQAVQPIGPNDQHTLTDLEIGDHEVGLDGVADNCGTHQPGIPIGSGLDPNPVRVGATAGGMLPLEFIVFCLEPDAGKLIIEQANFRLVSIDAWGRNLEVLTDNIGFDFHTNQDARRMVFFSEGEVWISDLDGANAIQLTDTPEDEAFPKLSPDGTTVAFSRFVDNTWMIFTMNVDGTGEKLIVDDGQEVAWSPDGGRIAYLGPLGIFTADADGSNQIKIPGTGFGELSPTWLPDGLRIVFIRDMRTLMIADVDTGAAETIGEQTSLKSGPTFSPDGRWIAYGSNAVEQGRFLFDVFVMPVAGGEAVRIMGGGGAIWVP